MKTNTAKTMKFLRAGKVRRYHTHVVNGEQDNGGHSWGVATIIALNHPKPSVELLKAALYHDVPEVYTGDVPYTTKKEDRMLKNILDNHEMEFLDEYGVLPVLTEEEKCWLKAADILELVDFSLCQLRRGNTHFEEIFITGLQALQAFVDIPEPLKEIVEAYHLISIAE